MNDHLYVWVYPGGEGNPVLCGVLELLQGRRCLFSYDALWVNRPNAFALSPDLPLQLGVNEPPDGYDIHPVFEDAGPDRWGKNVINKVFNPVRRSPLEYLELAGENRIGAMGFSRSENEYQVVEGAQFHTIDLPNLIRASEALALQMPIDDDLRRLLRPGSSAGGARPKAIIKHNNEDWIAKFPAEGDEHDVCAFEHASLILANKCGINVAKSELVKVDKQNVLLVKRFDRENDKRIHFVSARALLIAEGVKEGVMGYADIAEAARRLSSLPKENCHELYRRMVFNVFIENTDDHEKNHAFLYRDGEWELSPAYDVLPQLQGLGFHQIRIGSDGNEAKIANLLSEYDRFLLKMGEAESIVSEIHKQMMGWREVFSEAGVSSHDIDACDKYVLRNSIFQFGKIPEIVISPANQDYLGKIVAVDAQHVYQSVVRRQHVQYDRIVFNELILPNVELDIRHNEGKISIEHPKAFGLDIAL